MSTENLFRNFDEKDVVGTVLIVKDDITPLKTVYSFIHHRNTNIIWHNN